MPPTRRYGRNLLQNPSAETGDLSHWENIQNVTVVVGGVDGQYSFKFQPTASMEQTVGVPGQPPDLEFEAFFLPGRDIKSASQVRSDIGIIFHYGDGSTGRYLLPVKTFITGGR